MFSSVCPTVFPNVFPSVFLDVFLNLFQSVFPNVFPTVYVRLCIAENRFEKLTSSSKQFLSDKYTWSSERMTSSNIQSCKFYSSTNTLDEVKEWRPPYILRCQQTLELTKKPQKYKFDICVQPCEISTWSQTNIGPSCIDRRLFLKNLTNNILTHISLQIWLNQKVCLGLRHGW